MKSLHQIVELLSEGWSWQSIGFVLLSPDLHPHRVKALPGTRLYEIQPC